MHSVKCTLLLRIVVFVKLMSSCVQCRHEGLTGLVDGVCCRWMKPCSVQVRSLLFPAPCSCWEQVQAPRPSCVPATWRKCCVPWVPVSLWDTHCRHIAMSQTQHTYRLSERCGVTSHRTVKTRWASSTRVTPNSKRHCFYIHDYSCVLSMCDITLKAQRQSFQLSVGVQ